METAPLKSFATWARRELITQVSARLTAVLAPASPERVENQRAVTMLERDIAAAGGGAKGKDAVADKVAYTWFNRIIALRFMDANGYTGVGVVSPAHGQQTGQPEILADAKRGNIDPAVVSNKRTLDAITGLLDGTRPSADAQGEAYTLLLAEYCRYWNRSMPFMFEREGEGDYTELLIPANLLAADSILSKAASTLTAAACRDVEVIGWLYQFYISERKDEIFAGFKKGKKAGAAEIPAATQLFTPHWIVRYLVENSLGRLWMLNHPSSRLIEQMDYYIAPLDEETDFLTISSPEELKIIDPACGSGHMLTYAFDLLYAIYEEEGYAPSEIPELILIHNLYGTEIDPRAGALAAFALTMKARARQRTFLSKRVEPNICVIGTIAFGATELETLMTNSVGRGEVETLWNQFAAAGTRGALIRPTQDRVGELSDRLDDLERGADLLDTDVIARARQVLLQAEYLLPRYSVVIANPPYMGTRNMSSELAAWLAEEYPAFKSDLFAAFAWRCHELARRAGHVGVMSPNVWMYISSHQALRAALCDSGKLETLVELPLSGFKGATVQICAYTFATTARKSRRASFVRLTGLPGDSDFAVEAVAVVRSSNSKLLYRRESAGFASIPGTPVAYWLEPAVTANYAAGQLLGDAAYPRKGMDTGENSKFLRMWWEVSRRDLATTGDEGGKWFPYNKGGGFRRWYGNREAVINWANDGAAIRARLAWPSRKPTLRNQEFMKREGFSWGTISSGGFSARYSPPGAFFDNGGCTLFADHDLDRFGAFINSSTADLYLAFLAPTLNFQPGDIAKLPLPPGFATLEVETQRCVEIARYDWDGREESFDFERLRMIGGGTRLPEIIDAELASGRALAAELQRIEESNNQNIAATYGLSGIVSCNVSLEKVTLFCNPAYRLGQVDGANSNSQMARELVIELISYAVGCMFGRYSLDEPGLILGDQGATVQDYLTKVSAPTFAPDTDNVLPVVDGDWFEDDIVARFRQFLRVAFGEEYFEENLRFVEESLGVKSLREYFVTRAGRSRFYDDHVKRYSKRPIYWLFSSPKGSFNALIYMHRYTPSTVSTVLNEYLREFESKLEANLQHQERLAAGEGTPREKAAALKEAERLRKVLVELSEYEHDVLYPLASQQVAIDLDDGVKANYPKFYPALKKIAGLEATDD